MNILKINKFNNKDSKDWNNFSEEIKKKKNPKLLIKEELKEMKLLKNFLFPIKTYLHETK